MSNNKKDITIRKVEVSDLGKLTEFFIKAYGIQTIFQNERFLKYYFGSITNNDYPFSHCLIGLSPEGEIVSHYGGLYYDMMVNDKIVSATWGVNAYTLSEWRGKGINSKIVEYIYNNNEVNAVIGMPFDAPRFYKSIGYNMFNKETLSRYIYNLDLKTFEVIKQLGQNEQIAKNLIPVRTHKSDFNSKHLIELTNNNINNYKLNFAIDRLVTTHRSIDFLSWRLFKNPFIKYSVYGIAHGKVISAYIAVREEYLEPNNYTISRIIDLFGNTEGIISLLNFSIRQAVRRNNIYVDFSKYGTIFDDELMESNFTKLEDEYCSILPQVTAPIENRPNHEFIVIQSKIHHQIFDRLTKKDVYFTRIDGDRDRLGRLNQITNI
jgi:hypothetical protein